MRTTTLSTHSRPLLPLRMERLPCSCVCSDLTGLVTVLVSIGTVGHVPVTQGLAPAPSLSEALLRECRDMGPTLESRVSGPLGRHGVFVWAGCGRILMLC